MTEHWSEPIFFKVLDFMELQKSHIGRYLIALQFEQQELADPSGDLVGIAFWAGRRRYLWANKWWSEYPLESRLEIERLKRRMSAAPDQEFEILIKVLEWVYKYQESRPPEMDYKDVTGWQHLSGTQNEFIRQLQLLYGPPAPITRMLYPVN